MRETHEWTDAELDYLELWYALHGTAFIRQRFPWLTTDAIKQQASRLNLREDMQEFTPLTTVAREAGVTTQAVYNWLRERQYRKHCRQQHRTLLLPLPVARLYLTERRAPTRPKGWWPTKRAAAHLGVHVTMIHRLIATGELNAVTVGRAVFVDPQDVRDHHAERTYAPGTFVKVSALAELLGWKRLRVTETLRREAATVRTFAQPGRAPTLYTPATHARQFLTARGHHAEQVDTLLRKAQAIDAAGVKRAG